jgi:hypothetical protein
MRQFTNEELGWIETALCMTSDAYFEMANDPMMQGSDEDKQSAAESIPIGEGMERLYRELEINRLIREEKYDLVSIEMVERVVRDMVYDRTGPTPNEDELRAIHVVATYFFNEAIELVKREVLRLFDFSYVRIGTGDMR